MFYKFTDDSNYLRFVRFCEISEVNVKPDSVDSKPSLNLIMGNGKTFIKTFDTYEEAIAAAESVIRLAVSYKRNSKPPFKKDFPHPSTAQPRTQGYRNSFQVH